MGAAKLILAPVILVCAALGFPALEVYRRAHCYGWTSASMEPHWARLFRWSEPFHDAKNVMSEWVRLDPQRAGKLFSFALSVSLAINILLLITR